MSEHLDTELVDRYLKRSALFWKFSRDARFAKWQKLARGAAWNALEWNCEPLGISAEGKAAAERLGFVPSEVFAHPQVLDRRPELLEYYRLLSCLSNKGFGQIKKQLGLSRKLLKSPETYQLELCKLLNRFLSNALAHTASANREALIRTVFAEAGSEWQGTWVNDIGQLAEQELEKIIVEYADKLDLVDRNATEAAADEGNFLILKSGNVFCFGSEPDVECRSKKKELLCVIEVKGSADRAGAQTRLGETKKSFTKAKQENAHCVTIFLPSVVTSSVQKQLQTERDIDKVFNLLEIFKDTRKRDDFLTELFKFILREAVP